MSTGYPSFEEILSVQNIVVQMQIRQWTHHDVFSLQFWFLMLLMFVPWYIWWKLADKKRLRELLLYGSLVSTVVTILDEIGCQLNLWEYVYDIEPLFPRLLPVNLTILPVTFMLVYQFFPKWKYFLTAHALVAAVLSFIAEPVLVWMRIYVMFQWKHIYSFPFYILIPLLLKWLMTVIKAKELPARNLD